jgi:hypothetical protein
MHLRHLQFLATIVILILTAASSCPGSTLTQDSSHPNGVPSQRFSWNEFKINRGNEHPQTSLAVTGFNDRAVRIKCGFQKLEATVTPEGMWIESTAGIEEAGRFRVVSTAVGRGRTPLGNSPLNLATSGTVDIEGSLVRFIRPGLTEEFSTSMDGLRQDFLVTSKPTGAGDLRVSLAVDGAVVENSEVGCVMRLLGSGRELDYSRLYVVDAEGRQLDASMTAAYEMSGAPSTGIEIHVNDRDAVYPIRIDPVFSDSNWRAIGKIEAISKVYTAVTDGDGNLYIGGDFTKIDNVVVNRVAKWTGTQWLALGTGMDGGPYEKVLALAVSGDTLYAGGAFYTAGGKATLRVAKWDGSEWSPLGAGMTTGAVHALVASGDDLYAGGTFSNAGGIVARSIAKWDGSTWSALGEGMNGSISGVDALTISNDGTLYAGGSFDMVDGKPVNAIASWKNGQWSGLGTGVVFYPFSGPGSVKALAMMNGELYVGGLFTRAGGVPASNIARWNTIKGWSALGSGISGGIGGVTSLASADGILYAGGNFNKAGGLSAGRIARWKNNTWSALGSGIGKQDFTGFSGDTVYALATTLTEVFAVGQFSSAGGKAATSIARAWHSENAAPSSALSKLLVKSNILSPRFKSDKFNYDVKVASNVKSIKIIATAKAMGSKIKVNGVAVNSGKTSNPIPVKKPTTRVVIKVTAADGSKSTYRLRIRKKSGRETGKASFGFLQSIEWPPLK